MNDGVMYTSAHCLNMKSKYENASSQLQSVFGYIDDSITAIDLGIPYMDKLILNGETLDGGSLVAYKMILQDVRNNISQLVSECSSKITYWNSEYEAAKKRENGGATKA